MKITGTFFFIVFTMATILLPCSIKAQNIIGETSSKNVAVVPKRENNLSGTATKIKVSAIAQSVFDEINTARTEPEKYIEYLKEYRNSFKGNTVFLPNRVQIQTNEGIAPVDEAIEFLKQIPKLQPYEFSGGLNQISNAQLTDLMENPALGHRGKDGSNTSQRFAKFGRSGSFAAENISFYAETPRRIVIGMIIDDGVKNRMHRKNVFSPNFNFVGIAFGKSKAGEELCVVDFADFFTEKGESGVREF